MSRICELSVRKGTGRMKINSISIERSRVTKRNPVFSYPNLHKRVFNSELLGPMSIKLSNRSLRTVEKNGGIDGFLKNVKSGHLTEEYKVIKKRLIKLANIKFESVKKPKPINKRKEKKKQTLAI